MSDQVRRIPEQCSAENNVVPDALMSVGKDEMNLVEVPLSRICRRPIGGQKTFVVRRTVRDKKTSQAIVGEVIVTGSDAFGLLIPCDDVVIVGLISLTMKQAQREGKLSRKVFFSRYGLCNEIGWSASGRNYGRLEGSLDRFSGIRIKTKKAWWDKGEREWKTHSFGIIDNYELADKSRYDRKRPQGKDQLPLCYFNWNEVPFKSFSDGFIKSIDMNLFRAINRSAVALRLYRLADKRFHFDDRLEIDLRKLAREHLALSPSYSPSQMIREIDRGYRKLVEHGYLVNLPASERYRRAENGPCRVVLIRKTRQQPKAAVRDLARAPEKPSETATLEQELIRLGVEPGSRKGTSASSLVRSYTAKKIRLCISWWQEENTRRQARGQEPTSVAHLIASIRSENDRGFAPWNFRSRAETQAASEMSRQQEVIKRRTDRKLLEAQERKRRETWNRFLAFRNGFPQEEQRALEDKALAHEADNAIMLSSFQAERTEGRIGIYHQMLWERHIMLRQANSTDTVASRGSIESA